MPIVTVHGQFGSGAPTVGVLIAQRLPGQYIDQEVVTQVAARLQWPASEIAAKGEPPGSVFGRILEAFERTPLVVMNPGGFGMVYPPAVRLSFTDAHYLKGLVAVIKELGWGESVVIHGHGSQFILKGQPQAFHVLTVAPIDLRIQRVMRSLKLGEVAAGKVVARRDGSRRAFIKRYFGAELEDPAHYDLVLNTARISFEGTARVVTEVLSGVCGRPAGSSLAA